MSLTTQFWLTVGIFGASYLTLAVGRVPGLRVDRAGIAFIGAALVLVTGLLSLEEAASPRSIDYQTLFLLFGMMVVVAFLRISGFFGRLAHWSLDRIHGPVALLAAVIALSGVLSAFLVNDIVCLALTPLVLQLASRLRCDPTPHLIALATAANIGSSATITGNPQNMIIGIRSHIPYLTFAIHLMPVAAIGLLADFAVVAIVYRRSLSGAAAFTSNRIEPERIPHGRPYIRLLIKSVIVAVATVVLFFLGFPIALVAVGAAAVLMISRIRPARIYREIDWLLLLMFIGLFILVHAFQIHVLSRWDVRQWTLLAQHPLGLLSGASAALSNLVSNVPAVLLLSPLMQNLPPASRDPAWLALAMSSTLAGNLTILGSVANLIVVENARRKGVEISLAQYCKVGVPITFLTLALGVAWLRFVHY